MCTGITLGNKDINCNTLSRTLDFEFMQDSELVVLPRNHQWKGNVDQTPYAGKYALVGMGGDFGGYTFNEGVNEKGLAGAMLYLPHFAEYNEYSEEGYTNLAPYEVLKWILTTFSNVKEVAEACKTLNILKMELAAFKMLLPVHWIISDANGDTIVIEPLKGKVTVYEKTVGVMANSPSYDWHLTNLTRYISASSTPKAAKELNGLEIASVSEGSGMAGIPGDPTSISRFVRAAYGRDAMLNKNLIDSEQNAVLHAFKLLDNVAIPKGFMDTAAGHLDFSIYKICMSCSEKKYYYKTYVSDTLYCFDLMKQDLDAKEPKHFKLKNDLIIHSAE